MIISKIVTINLDSAIEITTIGGRKEYLVDGSLNGIGFQTYGNNTRDEICSTFGLTVPEFESLIEK